MAKAGAKVGLIVHLEIRSESMDEFIDIAKKHGANSQAIEEGCLGFDVLVPRDEPNRVILVEVYRDDDALEFHWKSDHMAAYLEKVKDMITDRKRYLCDMD